MNYCPQPLGHHFDDSWKQWIEPGHEPKRKPKPTAVEAFGAVLSEEEVISICRAHFATFANLTAAAEHYGLTDGRLSQIQTGVFVSCPRVQNALGIKRERGVYRWIDGSRNQAIAEPEPVQEPVQEDPNTVPDVTPQQRKPDAGTCISVGLTTRKSLIVEPAYLQGLTFGGAA